MPKFEQHDQHLSVVLNMGKASSRSSQNGKKIITNIANAAVAQNNMEVQRRATPKFDQCKGLKVRTKINVCIVKRFTPTL